MKKLLSLLLTFFTLATMNAQNKQQVWHEIDSLIGKGLPKSALEKIESQYKSAMAQNDEGRIIKTIVYRSYCQSQIEGNNTVPAMNDLRKELDEQKSPVVKALLHSLLGEQYYNYYNRNRWRFRNRTDVVGNESDDIETWSLDRIHNECLTAYKKSLSPKEAVQQAKIDEFNDIIIGNKNSRKYRPTLYDLLAQRAIEKIGNAELRVTKPAETFIPNDEAFYADARRFAAAPLQTDDTLSFPYFVLATMQELTKLHLQRGNQAALDDITLQRLQFVKNNSTLENRQEKLKQSFQDFLERCVTNETLFEAMYLLADMIRTEGDHVEAVKICTEALAKPAITDAQKTSFTNLLNEIKHQDIGLHIEHYNAIGKPIKARVDFKDVEKVYFRLYSVKLEHFYDNKLQQERHNNQAKNYFEKHAKLIRSWDVEMPASDDYKPHSTEIAIDALSAGAYCLLSSTSPDFFDAKDKIISSNDFQVTAISAVSRSRLEQTLEYYVADFVSGKPLMGATVAVYWNNYGRKEEKKGAAVTDQMGIATITNLKDRLSYALVTYGGDMIYVEGDYLRGKPYEETDRKSTSFFLDRAIYRPGQLVHFKGLVLFKAKGKEAQILPNTKETVTLRDVNGQEVSTIDVLSNDYGTFSGTFPLPTSALGGSFSIRSKYGNTSFRVEEYKRPTFEVTMNSVDGSPKFGDKVKVSGTAKAYAGYSIDGAKVSYNVTRQMSFPYRWWWYDFDSSTKQIAYGETTTDADGVFSIEFSDEAKDLKNASQIAVYTVSADVTDNNGETHGTQYIVRVSKKPLVIITGIPDNIDKEDGDFVFALTTENLNGDFDAADVDVKITRLQQPSNPLRKRLWDAPDKPLLSREKYKKLFPNDVYGNENRMDQFPEKGVVKTFKFNTSKQDSIVLKELAANGEAYYKVTIKAKNAKGIEAETIEYLHVIDKTANIADMENWIREGKKSDQDIEYYIGGTDENNHVRLEVLYRDNIVKAEDLVVGNKPKLIKVDFPQTQNDEDFIIRFSSVMDGRFYQKSRTLSTWKPTYLDIQFITFRDKLQPGEKEQWKLRIKSSNGEKATAEMVASLYDASLDAFVSHYWYGPSTRAMSYSYGSSGWNEKTFGQEGSSILSRLPHYYLNFPSRTYEQLFSESSVWQYAKGLWVKEEMRLASMSSRSAKMDGGRMLERSAPMAMAVEEVAEEIALNENAVSSYTTADLAVDAGDEEAAKPEPQIRSNFSETAFFYPELRTDENGEISIEFTIPEALTRWKMLGFAHTKNLEMGRISKELVTQKDVAISMNAPRFFRVGDRIELSAKVNNVTERILTGNAKLEMFDAFTMQPISIIDGAVEQPFSVDAGRSTSVKWSLKIPDRVEALTYRVTAVTPQHSDGEERALPVLPNSMLVTESMPFTVRGNQTKDFTFEKMAQNNSTTLKNYSYTLEFTSNPVWYAVQALPYLMEYPYECSEQVFARFYANSISKTITDKFPQIKRTFDIWKTTDSKELLSNLEKNQELKNILLEETPWVRNAQNESEAKKRIALLFDLNKMQGEQESALKKLADKQLSDGAFPWFKGMCPSWYLTQHIAVGLEHLKRMNAVDAKCRSKVDKISSSAMKYCDKEMLDYYKEMKKNKVDLEKYEPGGTILQYLYLRSFIGTEGLSKEQKTAFDYFFSQLAKYNIGGSLYRQGLAALTLGRLGRKDKALETIKSLKEHSKTTEEMGMFWEANRVGYFWYQAPIETQALLIEAFDELGSKEDVEEMKIWLLKNKQTNDWKTTRATSEAVYALLMQGNSYLDKNKLLQVKLGGIPLEDIRPDDVQNAEAGTGYVKSTFTREAVERNYSHVNVTNPNNGIAWGASYWQYFENLEKITSAEAGVKIKREYFVIEHTIAGDKLRPIGDKSAIKVGDKVRVRLELRADRDYEYVHLKDMRASGFEPANTLSGSRNQDGLWYYENTRDAATNFFIYYLRKGTYVFEYDLRANNAGDFSTGIATFQCMYAPEFSAHSAGIRIEIKN